MKQWRQRQQVLISFMRLHQQRQHQRHQQGLVLRTPPAELAAVRFVPQLQQPVVVCVLLRQLVAGSAEASVALEPCLQVTALKETP